MLVKTFVDRFHDLDNLYFENDIYSEIKIPLKPFKLNNPYAIGKGFDLKEYMQISSLKFWKCIKFFVDSEIPNCFFTMPWDEYFNCKEKFVVWLEKNKDFDFTKEYLNNENIFSFIYLKQYWEYFAIILACRGAEKVLDVSKPILNMFVDINRLGFFPLQCLVANNIKFFKKDIKDCIFKAKEEGENYWLDYLTALLTLE